MNTQKKESFYCLSRIKVEVGDPMCFYLKSNRNIKIRIKEERIIKRT